MVKKAQLYIIEATLSGVAIMMLIGLVFFFNSTQEDTHIEKIKSNYCEDSLNVLIKTNTLQNRTQSINYLKEILPKNIVYCLIIDNQKINDYGCSKIKGGITSCRGIYTYLDKDDKYHAEEVQLLLN